MLARRSRVFHIGPYSPTIRTCLTRLEGLPDTPLLNAVVDTFFNSHFHASRAAGGTGSTFL